MWIYRYVRLPALVAALAIGACRSAPPYEGMDAQEIYAHALQAYENEDWKEASRAFERLLITYPSFPQRIEARLYLAHAYFGQRQYITAESEYRRMLTTAPAHELSAAASLGICRSFAGLSPKPERDQTDTQSAVRACEATTTDYAGTPEAAQARAVRLDMLEKLAEKDYRRGEFYYRRNLIDSAILYYQIVADEYPETTWAPEALLRIVEANTRIGYDVEANRARDQLLNNYPDSPAAQALSNGA